MRGWVNPLPPALQQRGLQAVTINSGKEDPNGDLEENGQEDASENQVKPLAQISDVFAHLRAQSRKLGRHALLHAPRRALTCS